MLFGILSGAVKKRKKCQKNILQFRNKKSVSGKKKIINKMFLPDFLKRFYERI